MNSVICKASSVKKKQSRVEAGRVVLDISALLLLANWLISRVFHLL
jgi:hypothetical protein